MACVALIIAVITSNLNIYNRNGRELVKGSYLYSQQTESNQRQYGFLASIKLCEVSTHILLILFNNTCSSSRDLSCAKVSNSQGKFQ